MGKPIVTLDDAVSRLESLAALTDLVFTGIQYHADHIGQPANDLFERAGRAITADLEQLAAEMDAINGQIVKVKAVA